MSIFAFSSSRQMIAVARSGRTEEPLPFVVRTFQAPRVSGCFLEVVILPKVCCCSSVTPDAIALYGLRPFFSTAVFCGASATPNAVALYVIRLFVATAVSCGASFAPNAVTISSSLICAAIKK